MHPSLRLALQRITPPNMAAADFSLREIASPLQAQGEISPGKSIDLLRTTAGSTQLPLGHESFVVACPLALVHHALYPIPVRRPTDSLTASFSAALTGHRLAGRFGSCDQVPGGLTPPSQCPCRAHTQRGRSPKEPASKHDRGAVVQREGRITSCRPCHPFPGGHRRACRPSCLP